MANCQKIDPGGECGSTLLLLPLFFLPLFFLCSPWPAFFLAPPHAAHTQHALHAPLPCLVHCPCTFVLGPPAAVRAVVTGRHLPRSRALHPAACLAMDGADKHAMANACKLMCNATCDELGTASWPGSLPLKPPAQARECCYRSCCTTHYPVPDGPYLKTYVNLILAPAGARIKLT